jgi:hypothetical protein
VELDPGMTNALAAYGKTVDGRPMFLVVSYLTSETIDFVGCILYDFRAITLVPQAPLDALLGEAPYQTTNQAGNLVAQIWDTPEKLPGTWDVYSGYAVAGGPSAKQAGFSGVGLRITSIDPKDK